MLGFDSFFMDGQKINKFKNTILNWSSVHILLLWVSFLLWKGGLLLLWGRMTPKMTCLKQLMAKYPSFLLCIISSGLEPHPVFTLPQPKSLTSLVVRLLWASTALPKCSHVVAAKGHKLQPDIPKIHIPLV